MRIIRGWESRYAPAITGGLRLSKASVYRRLGEEEGLGDPREGEIRILTEGTMKLKWDDGPTVPFNFSDELEQDTDAQLIKHMSALLAERDDDPDVEIERQGVGVFKVRQHKKMDDSMSPSPFLFCMSREPLTKDEWDSLQAALPPRYDFWTVTELESIPDLHCEIEIAIKRWMTLNEIKSHVINTSNDWVTYEFDVIPPSVELSQSLGPVQITRWFRKRKQYKEQREYRLASLLLDTPDGGLLPEAINVELTKTGLELFQPWEPPD